MSEKQTYSISIFREFGSLGRSIARILSEELGISFYDRDIVEQTARRLNLPVSRIEEYDEKTSSDILYKMFPLGMDDSDMQDRIFQVQRQIILDFVNKDSCIIVGRGANAILEERPNNINIFIYASKKDRLHNCTTVLEMEEAAARRAMTEVDKARSRFHKKYCGYLPGDKEHYDFCINSSVLGVQGTAKLIAEIARIKFPDATDVNGTQ